MRPYTWRLYAEMQLGFTLLVTIGKTAEMRAVQGVVSTEKGAYIDLCIAHRRHGEGLQICTKHVVLPDRSVHRRT